MFDWRKGALHLLSVAVALCAFTGRADDSLFPYFPFDPGFPIPLIISGNPDRDNTEPIIFVCSRFFASENANLLGVYDDRIAANDKDYEAYICRAFVRVGTLFLHASEGCQEQSGESGDIRAEEVVWLDDPVSITEILSQ